MQTIIEPGQVLPDLLHHDPHIPAKSSVGTYAGQSAYFKNAPRAWGDRAGRGGYVDPYHLSGTPLFLSGRDAVEITLPSPEVFQWRLRDVALAAAERSGVSVRTVHEMCMQFGSPEPLLYVGGIVSNKRDMARLPLGSILYVGHPDMPSSLTVYEWDGDQAQKILGHYNQRPEGQPLTIHTMPGVEDRQPDMTPGDDVTISRIAQRAWRIGRGYQDRHGWCGVFNNCLLALGINHDAIANVGTGSGPGDDVIGADTIARLPEGTILYHRYRASEAFTVWIRDDSARTTSKTRRLWGSRDVARNGHDRMTIASTPEEPHLNLPVTGEQLRDAPAGTQYHRTGMAENRTVGGGHAIDYWAHYVITNIVTEENAA